MDPKSMRGRVRKAAAYVLLICLLGMLLPAPLALAWPYGVDHSIFYLDSEPDSLSPNVEFLKDGQADPSGDPDNGRAKTIVGASLFGSGIFLCSWGIASWETDDTQCCPTNNTQNVIKIVVGVLLLNAGLVYLLEMQ
ncbi:hypothetical protein ACFL2Z_00675 [Candidatus Eisenbacteria bacterium]|uniref:Uncharacterized protein n=1 Tax=Eiseniibacteriota bacterium TaxID=2212470 RepID=A0ABV6YMV4_UNCEI